MRAVLFTIFLMAWPGFAVANPIAEIICEATDDMMDRLSGDLMSTRQAIGVRSEEELMEVWLDARGDWVLVATYASGTSCIVAMGEHWQALDTQEPA